MAKVELLDEQPLNITISEPQTLNETISPQENIDVETTDGWYEKHYTETDPVFSRSPASSITDSDITNWNSKTSFSGDYDDLTNKPTIPDELSDLSDDSTHRLVTDTEKATWSGKQDGLVSGTNIKTINNESLLGSGNITIQGGSGGGDMYKSTYDTDDNGIVDNAEKVNNHTVNSDVPADAVFTDTTYESKSASSGGTAVSLVTTGEKYTWNNKSDFSGDYTDLSNKPTIPTVGNSKIYYGTCSTAKSTADKVVTCSTFVLEEGAHITVSFKYDSGTSNLTTLNVNNTGAIRVYRRKSSIVTGSSVSLWQSGEMADFTYNGEVWVIHEGAIASTEGYGVIQLLDSVSSTVTSNYAATPNSVKRAYDLADGKQDALVSGTNIKTINSNSLLGSGDITTFSGSYNDLTNKPTIPTVPSTLSSFTDDLGSSPIHTHSQYLTEHQDISGKVDKVAGKGLSTNDFTDTYKTNVDNNTSARHTHSNKSVLDGISSSDITNWNGKISGITSSDVTTALGYTPEKEKEVIFLNSLSDIEDINSTTNPNFIDIKNAIDDEKQFVFAIYDAFSGDWYYYFSGNYEHLTHFNGRPESYSFSYMEGGVYTEVKYTINGTSITTTTEPEIPVFALNDINNISSTSDATYKAIKKAIVNNRPFAVSTVSNTNPVIYRVIHTKHSVGEFYEFDYSEMTDNSNHYSVYYKIHLAISGTSVTVTETSQSYQPALISGLNIKTINGDSVLGSGNINISGGLTIDDVYPVGSIYMSVSSTSPATLFGGTWQQIKDTFLLSCGDTYSNGTTGGSADAVVVSHTHTMESDGTHNHGLKYTNNGGSGTARSVMSSTGTNTSTGVITSDGAHTHTINSSGESGTGKNMPPYLAVYMWKRTA